MRVGNFSVLIPEGVERDSQHVALPHNTPYQIRMGNHNYRLRCDAEVRVDGKDVGCFRIEAGGSFLLERPSHDSGKFTFLEIASAEATAAGVSAISRDDRGLVQVTFRPEKVRPPVYRDPSHAWGLLKSCSAVPMNASYGASADKGGAAPLSFGKETKTSAGITGLTGKSDQTFHTVAALDYEVGAEVTISLRLVAGAAVRPLTPAPRGNPVPAPVE